MAYFIMYGLAAPYQHFGIPTMSAAAMVSPLQYIKWVWTKMRIQIVQKYRMAGNVCGDYICDL